MFRGLLTNEDNQHEGRSIPREQTVNLISQRQTTSVKAGEIRWLSTVHSVVGTENLSISSKAVQITAQSALLFGEMVLRSCSTIWTTELTTAWQR